MNKLKARQSLKHTRGIKWAKLYGKAGRNLVEALISIEEEKIHKLFGKATLYKYVMAYYELSESVSLMLIDVARKAKQVPALRKALNDKIISAPKASRLVSTINQANAEELIQFASCHSSMEIDLEVRKRNPRAKQPDRYKIISENQVQLTITVDMESFLELRRAQSLLAQKQKPAGMSDAVATGLKLLVESQDPVKKAERYTRRAAKDCPNQSDSPQTEAQPQSFCLNRTKRTPIPAAAKYMTHLRDQGRCTHIDHEGKRCNSDRWVEIHHIIPVSRGGTNHPNNLTTLCSFHHDLVHQLSLPIEGQITWLR